MSTTHPEPKLIPIPDNFKFEWSSPEDSHLPLIQDRQHAPSPLTPLSGWLAEHHWAKGASAGFAAVSQPVAMRVRRINTYYYMAVIPAVPPEQMEEAGHKAEESLKALIPIFADRWENEWLPEIRGYHATWNAFDLKSATDEELLAHLEWTIETFTRLWSIHFEVAVPFMVAPSMFFDLYSDLIEGAGTMDAFKLLQGANNDSLRAGSDLWELSRVVTQSDELKSTVLNTPTSELMGELEKSTDGQRFLESLGVYLGKWGNRSDTVIEIGDPSWVEDPTILINNVKAYLGDDAHDPVAQWKELVAERERLVEEVQVRIAGYPEPVKQQFNGMLAAGQAGHRIQEDHNWWIDQQVNHQVRQVYREFGNRLTAAGTISNSDDVFMLMGDEIVDSAKAGFSGDLKSVASERRAEMERWEKVPAAHMVGTDYGQPPDNPVTRALGRFFGMPPAPPSPDHPELISGAAGSPGKVTGTARVIIKLSDAGRLKQGDILVTATTSPPWTPIFATAGGIVTDTGGALSHCAIVAREYGLPATVGTGRGTVAIKDGQRIEVDGDAGTVRILES